MRWSYLNTPWPSEQLTAVRANKVAMYYVCFIFCYLCSLLPLRVLYVCSDFAYLIVYRVAGYRKAVVMSNLEHAFPEYSAEERQRVARAFYHHLTDMMVETVKLFSISEKGLQRRFSGDLSLIDRLQAEGRGFQIHLGHYFNWEWANLYIKSRVGMPFLVTYMPLSNRVADRLFKRMRARFGSVMISARDVRQAMKPWQGKSFINVLVADQNPGKVRRAYWFPFMHRMTAFYKGPELSARRGDQPVVYGEIQRRGRGNYHISLTLISDHPEKTEEGAVTGVFVRLLEQGIRAHPENWVWSHRRWKHTWKNTTDAPGPLPRIRPAAGASPPPPGA